MQGHNALFTGNFATYLNGVIVDNVSWFRNMANNGAVVGLGVPKAGQFDLLPTGINPSRVQFRIAPVGGIIGDAAIGAYWCPFDSGGELPGWVDLPMHNPAHNLMFTMAMQGCALVVTGSPLANHFRVYHHQHPDMSHAAAAVWGAIHAQGQPVISVYTFDDYGLAGLNGNAPNAFNFLLYRNGNWNYVTQAHTLTNVMGPNGLFIQVNRRPVHGNNGVSIASLQ